MYQSTHTGAQVDEAVDKALSADAVPTPDSTNLVQSGGVFAALSNRNLLDNWYFVSPVNQRGQTVFTAGYCIDRWYNEGLSGSSIELVSGGLKLTNTTSQRARISQAFESSLVSFLTWKNCTISAIVDGVLYSAIKPMFANNSPVSVGPLDVFSPTGSNSLLIQLTASNPARTATISAVKLELGSISTLANDAPPNFAEELAKCQRYFYKYTGLTTAAALANSTVTACTIPFPVTMRGTPTISGTTYYDEKQSTGHGAFVSGVRYYNGSSVAFSVTGFSASADI